LLVIAAVCSLATVVATVPLIRIAAYEASGAGKVRSAIGKQVAVEYGYGSKKGIYSGKLLDARYRLNDKAGWIELVVHIDGEGGTLRTGISPEQIEQFR